MTKVNYSIADVDGELFVIQQFEHGHSTFQDVRHGPYKNRKSAVGRINDLKKRDAITTPLGAALEDAPIEPNEPYHNPLIQHPSHETTIDPQPVTASLDNYVPLRTVDHDARKLASSSAYGNSDPGWINPPFNPQPHPIDAGYETLPIGESCGKFKLDPVAFAKSIDPLAAGMNNLDMSKFNIIRPVGCYPAISKHEYQR